MRDFLDAHAFHIVGLACWAVVAWVLAWKALHDRRRRREWAALTAVVDAARADFDPLRDLRRMRTLADLGPEWSRP